MKKIRKMILGLGAVGVVATTGSVILSCGSNGTNWIDASKEATGFVPWSGMDSGASMPIKPSEDMKPYFDDISWNTINDVVISHLGQDNLKDLVWSPDWVWTFDTNELKDVYIKILTWDTNKDYDKENYKCRVDYDYCLSWHALFREDHSWYVGYLYDKTETEKMLNLKSEDVTNEIKSCVEFYKDPIVGIQARLNSEFFNKHHNIADLEVDFQNFPEVPKKIEEDVFYLFIEKCTLAKGGLSKDFYNINFVIKYQ